MPKGRRRLGFIIIGVMVSCFGIALIAFLLTSECSSQNDKKCLVKHEDNSFCYPPSDSSKSQFIIGYGSLINTASKLRTLPLAGPSIPIIVHGYERLWDAQGDSHKKYSTTYLGVRHDVNSSFNGVVFQVPASYSNPLEPYDFREDWYCRKLVQHNQIQLLIPSIEYTKESQAWIYVTRPSHSALPNSNHPILLSYVDIFLSGCLEIEDDFHLDGFATYCITSTSNWGSYYLNNRNKTLSIHLRSRIDKLLEPWSTTIQLST